MLEYDDLYLYGDTMAGSAVQRPVVHGHNGRQ